MAALAKVYIPPPEEPESHDGAMSFLGHLEELRTRLVRASWAIGAGILVAFAFVDRLADFVLAPARRALPPAVTIIYTHPGEGFGFYIEVAMLAGFVFAAPFVVYQLWLFIAPALYVHEKKLVIPFVLLGSAGIVGGAAFGHYVMFPSMMTFFASYHTANLRFMPQLDDVFRLYTIVVVGMTAVFQIPTVVFFAARMRVVSARFLWRHLKYAILLIFIIAAVITPSSDPWNQIMFAAPMIGLYVLSIGIAWAAAPRDRSRA